MGDNLANFPTAVGGAPLQLRQNDLGVLPRFVFRIYGSQSHGIGSYHDGAHRSGTRVLPAELEAPEKPGPVKVLVRDGVPLTGTGARLKAEREAQHV